MDEEQKTILVIDDEEDLCEAVATALSREGFRVCTAQSGETGAELALSEKPDLIFLDLVMAEMGGIEVLNRLRADGGEWGKHVPIIVMTVLGDVDKIAEVVSAGANAHVVKTNINLAEVVALAQSRLGLRV